MNFIIENPQLLIFGFIIATGLIVYAAWVFLVQRRFFKTDLSRIATFSAITLVIKAAFTMLAFNNLSAVNTNPPGADTEPIVLDPNGNPVVVVTTTGTEAGKILKSNKGKLSVVRVNYLDAEEKVLDTFEVELASDIDTDASYVVLNNTSKKPPAGTATINTHSTFWVERNEIDDAGSRIGVLSRNLRNLVASYRTTQLKASRPTTGKLDLDLALNAKISTADLTDRLKAYVTITALNSEGRAATVLDFPGETPSFSSLNGQDVLAQLKNLSTSGLDPNLKWHIVMELRFNPASGTPFLISQAESAVLDP